jgi:hypothetical protein
MTMRNGHYAEDHEDDMTPQVPILAPNSIGSVDVDVLIGLLAGLEGYLMGEHPDADLVDPLRKRFVRAGLLPIDADERDFRQAVNDMNHRLRYTAGEYPEPIAPLPVSPTRHPGQ